MAPAIFFLYATWLWREYRHFFLKLLPRNWKHAKPREYRGPTFSIFLPPYWKPAFNEKWYQPDQYSVSLYNCVQGNGFLRIQTFTLDQQPSKGCYTKYAWAYLHHKMTHLKAPKKTVFNNYRKKRYHYWICKFSVKERYWFFMVIAFRKKIAHMIYNCTKDQSKLHQTDLETIISSLKFKQ